MPCVTFNGALAPTDPGQLRYVYEDGLAVHPGFAMVLGRQDGWFADPGFGIDMVRVLHTDQRLVLRRPLAPQGRVRVSYAVEAVQDRGARRGVQLAFGKTIADAATGEEIAQVSFCVLCLGDRATRDFGKLAEPLSSPPTTPPEASVPRDTDPRAALIYRLSGDRNPLHADPEIARRAGFDRPILHGLCTLGTAAHALIDAVAGGDPARVTGLHCRFSRPVYPGERLETDRWSVPDGALFRVRVPARNEVVINRGLIRVA